jgi:Na+-transporting methylmalonyl-CoA/oxaloacetate decarboxylase gamma subunit
VDFIFVFIVLFILMILATRTRRLLKRLEKEEPKNKRDTIIIRHSLDENQAPQSVEEEADVAVA